ncbi:metalloaminopeptidase [Aureococcus anophagefferens]|nr:metalloaminopeptidase [Aureococcus anophagefferens]
MADLMSAVGGFAMLCRCGIEKCATHVTSDMGDRVVLPPSVEPKHYDVSLSLRLEEHAFDGVCEIVVDVKEPVSSITVHAKELTFASASVGEHRLAFVYSGVLNNLMAGFYRSTYTDIDGNKKLMASTQFESIDARRCFPGWDEPRRKATFTCALRCPSHMTALSNMPESRRKNHGDGTTTTSFMESPRMSTYLLCFVVGEFDHVSAVSKNGVLIRAFTPPGKPELGEFALRCAVKSLDALRRDVAIPEFAAGAMENWGLVTYREVDMLVDLKTASSRQLQRVAEVVIHELAHQWFGNLVTMEWWEDLWLNEGFATWMETGARASAASGSDERPTNRRASLFADGARQVCAELYPEWSMWEQFITDMQGRALQLDALRSSHPIQVPIKNAEEVEQVFDAISYCKGGSVVRMVHAVVGETDFVGGLRASARAYMKEFQYGNATTDDLWAAWEKASGKPVRDMMNNWTKQTGFPVLELEKVEADGSLVLSQRRFFADGAADDAAATWTVPLFAATAASGETSLGLMPGKAATVAFGGAAGAPYVKLNAGQHAPLRCKYPDAMMPAFAEAIRRRELPPADRIGLLSDAAALSRAGDLDFALYLEILFAFEGEDDATVWSQVLALLGLIKTLRGADDRCAGLYAAFKKLASAALIAPTVASVGWDPKDEDAHLTKKLRGEVISALRRSATTTALAEATRRFDLFKAGDKDALPAEYQSAAYKLVLAADAGRYAEVKALYDSLPLNEERKSCLVGLGAAPTPELRDAALDLALSEDVKLQDFFYAKIGDSGSSLMDAVVTGACSGYSSEAAAAEIVAFFDANPLPRNERKISQTVGSSSRPHVETILQSDAQAWLDAKLKAR